MDAVEEVKSRINIEDIVGEYVQLKRAGRNFKGLSPFGNEKTPSFIVSPEKQIWHDFSSGKGGSVFNFVMEMEGLDFKGALEHLARKAGVDLSQYQSGQSAETGKLKERLYQALEVAAKFYQVQFSKNVAALEYIFKQRAFSKEVALEFRIGYSPNNGTALIDYMKKRGFTDTELQKAGLTAKRYHGTGDMFRGRIMIPLQDAQGKVIGFTARLLDEDPDAPKYINTPQTLLYDKSRHVYGLHLAKDALRKEKYAVLVEGNLDVIASHQAGIRQVVATAGTALTEMHLKTLSRFTNDIRLSFDQDRAGQAATERAIPIASKVGVTLSMITIPSGKDPDELVKQDPKIWQRVITQHEYALDWLMARYAAQLDVDSVPGKREFSDVMLRVVRQLPDAVEQDHYLAKIAKQLGVSKDAMRSKLDETPEQRQVFKKSKAAQTTPDRSQLEFMRLQDQLLGLALMQPDQRVHLKYLDVDVLEGKPAQTLCKYLQQHPDFDGKLSQAPELKDVADYVKIVSLQYETLYTDLDEVELGYEASRLQVRLIEIYVKTKKNRLIEQMRESLDEATTRQLVTQARSLDELLKQTKETT